MNILNPDIVDIVDIIDKIEQYNKHTGGDLRYLILTYHTFRTKYNYDESAQKILSEMVKNSVITRFERFLILRYLKNHR